MFHPFGSCGSRKQDASCENLIFECSALKVKSTQSQRVLLDGYIDGHLPGMHTCAT